MVMMGVIEREIARKEMNKFKSKVKKTDTETLNEERSILKPKEFMDYLDLERVGKFNYVERIIEERKENNY